MHTCSCSLADAMVSRSVRDWYEMVANHVSFDDCVGAASEALSCGH